MKIQPTIATNFLSSKHNDEECIVHSKSDNTEIVGNDKEGELKEGLILSWLSRYQIGLETSMKDTDFIFDYCIFHIIAHFILLHYNKFKINFKRDGFYIDSPDWIKN